MQSTNSTEFRKHVAQYLSAAEEGGEVVIIVRHGMPIAKLVPLSQEELKAPWHEPALLMKVKGVSLTEELLKDRSEK